MGIISRPKWCTHSAAPTTRLCARIVGASMLLCTCEAGHPRTGALAVDFSGHHLDELLLRLVLPPQRRLHRMRGRRHERPSLGPRALRLCHGDGIQGRVSEGRLLPHRAPERRLFRTSRSRLRSDLGDGDRAVHPARACWWSSDSHSHRTQGAASRRGPASLSPLRSPAHLILPERGNIFPAGRAA